MERVRTQNLGHQKRTLIQSTTRPAEWSLIIIYFVDRESLLPQPLIVTPWKKSTGRRVQYYWSNYLRKCKMNTNTRKLKTMGYGQFHLKTILSHLRGVAENVETFFNILLKQSVSQYSDCNSDHDSSGFSLHLSMWRNFRVSLLVKFRIAKSERNFPKTQWLDLIKLKPSGERDQIHWGNQIGFGKAMNMRLIRCAKRGSFKNGLCGGFVSSHLTSKKVSKRCWVPFWIC